MSIYVIRIDQGDYLQQRGGFDWGRASINEATQYSSLEEAKLAAKNLGIESLVREYVDLLDLVY